MGAGDPLTRGARPTFLPEVGTGCGACLTDAAAADVTTAVWRGSIVLAAPVGVCSDTNRRR